MKGDIMKPEQVKIGMGVRLKSNPGMIYYIDYQWPGNKFVVDLVYYTTGGNRLFGGSMDVSLLKPAKGKAIGGSEADAEDRGETAAMRSGGSVV